MALYTDPIFAEPGSGITDSDLAEALDAVSGEIGASRFHYFGFAQLDRNFLERHGVRDETFPVDNFLLLQEIHPVESLPAVMSVGLGGSRFGSVLYWEIFHALALNGCWIEIEKAACVGTGTPWSAAPVLEREFYQPSLQRLQEIRLDKLVVRIYRKVAPSRLTARSGEPGWSFGILTAGESPAARSIILEILRCCPEPSEVIVCGPLPSGLPDDPRIRHIDLERPEPRGWITRKKNLIADAARFDQLCLLHDRFVFPENFFSAMKRYGRTCAVLTFPQVYYPDASRTFMLRYPDYQVLLDPERYYQRGPRNIFNSDDIFHLQYNDYYPAAFCCGGLYVTSKTLWNLVRQDESLFHCEWEDIVFGLACQEKGIPHRVNPYALFESINPHLMLLNGMHVVRPDGRRVRMLPQVSDHHRRMARVRPEGFKAVIGLTESEYRSKLMGKLAGTAVNGVELPARAAGSPFLTWSCIYLAALCAPVAKREDIFNLYVLLSETIFNFPNCILQKWCRDTELELARERTSGAPSKTASLIYKRCVGIVLRLRSITLLRALRRVTAGRFLTFYPILEMIEHFLLVERDYPRMFNSRSPSGAPEPTGSAEQVGLSSRAFRDSELGRTMIFCTNSQGEVVPPLQPCK